MARKIAFDEVELELPDEPENVIDSSAGQLLQPHAEFRKLDLRLAALKLSHDRALRLASIPGIGTIGATALAA